MDQLYKQTLIETKKKDKQRLIFYETSLINLQKRITYLTEEMETLSLKILEARENIEKINIELSIDKDNELD